MKKKFKIDRIKKANVSMCKQTLTGILIILLSICTTTISTQAIAEKVSSKEHKVNATNNLNTLPPSNTAQADDKKLNVIENKLKEQQIEIERLNQEVQKAIYSSNNDYSSLLLTAVAVIVTALGVIIALLSILGYRNIKNVAIKNAKKVATITTSELVKKDLPNETKTALLIVLKDKKFDPLFQEAINKVVFRGINSETESQEEDEAN